MFWAWFRLIIIVCLIIGTIMVMSLYAIYINFHLVCLECWHSSVCIKISLRVCPESWNTESVLLASLQGHINFSISPLLTQLWHMIKLSLTLTLCCGTSPLGASTVSTSSTFALITSLISMQWFGRDYSCGVLFIWVSKYNNEHKALHTILNYIYVSI